MSYWRARAGAMVAVGAGAAVLISGCGSSDAKEDVAITSCRPGGAPAATTGVTSQYPTVAATVKNANSRTGKYKITFGFYLGDKQVTSSSETSVSVSSHSSSTVSALGKATATDAAVTCKVTRASRTLTKKKSSGTTNSNHRRRHH